MQETRRRYNDTIERKERASDVHKYNAGATARHVLLQHPSLSEEQLHRCTTVGAQLKSARLHAVAAAHAAFEAATDVPGGEVALVARRRDGGCHPR